MSDQKPISRRNFMGLATWAIGSLIGLGMTVPAIIYIAGPALKREDSEEWIRLGATSKVELGIPTLFKAKIQRQTGWILNEDEISVYILTENGRDYVAISNICTHLGCRVRWIDEQGQFFCPCHNAEFDKAGKVLAGPPPRPLYQYQVKVEGDQLFILGG